MKKIFFCLTLFIVAFTLLMPQSIAQDKANKDFLITKNSVGFVQIGVSLKDTTQKAKEIGYSIKKNDTNYVLFDNNNIPLLKFTIFNSQPRKKPIRTITTTSSKFKLDNGLSLIGTPLYKLEDYFSVASIYRVKPEPDAPEFVDFKSWPFSDSTIYEGYIIKYKATLNKIADEYGKTTPVGKYENRFCLFTNNFFQEAQIETFQIEATEPKIKFSK